MWTRPELKNKSKQFLREYMLKAVITCLIFTLIEGIFSGNGGSSNSSYEDNNTSVEQNQMIDIPRNLQIENFKNFHVDMNEKYEYSIYNKNTSDNIFINKLTTTPKNNFDKLAKFATISVTGTLLLILFVVGILGSIFIVKPMRIGLKRFFLNGYRYDEVRVADMFTTFTDNHWVGYALKMLYVDMIIFLWSLLLIIPGIVKGYQYYYVPYILSDHPEYSAKEAMMLSKEMTSGKKFDIFVLNLSFIPWIIVSVLTFGLGFLILTPYMEGTYAALYLHENDEKESNYEIIEEF